MKVGILTFHRAYNYGAFLQCYSLQEKLKEVFPNWDIEVIDYLSGNMDRYYQYNIRNYIFGPYNTLSNRNIVSMSKNAISRLLQIMKGESTYSSYLCNKNIQDSFKKDYGHLQLSNTRFIGDNYTKSIEFLNKCMYDIIIVGSDAIWNDEQTSRPNVYFLSDTIKCHKLSYAASCYGMDYQNVVDIDYIQKALRSYDYIGVRDIETEKYIKSLLPDCTIYHNCDPSLFLNVLSLPVDMDNLYEKIYSIGLDMSKPIYGVMGDAKIGEIARKTIGENAQLLGLYYENKYCSASLIDLSPFEWARIFSILKVTFTSFFHGTIFSLKNGTPTITIERNSNYASKYTTKTQDILTRMGLSDYYIADVEALDIIRQQIELYDKENQKDRIEKGLQAEIDSCKTFFSALNNM